MIYAIGDIHGKAGMLTNALVYLSDKLLKPEDTVVFLGDYIDRGEDSHGVFDILRTFKVHHAQSIFLRGNHEALFMDAFRDPECEVVWLYNGGLEMLASYEIEWTENWRLQIRPEDIDFVEETEIEYETKYFKFVHAGYVPPGEGNTLRPDLDPRLWIREDFINSTADFGKVVIFGHTVQTNWLPLVMPNKIGLDTGAAFGGRLSVAGFDDEVQPGLWPDFTLFQVDQYGDVTVLEWQDE
ncbi:MAG: metallophosphoesterase family protein [Capsulimonadaceae bacterium]